MKKLFSIGVYLILFAVITNAQTDSTFYYYQGNKIYLHYNKVADITGVAVLTHECHEPVTQLDVSHLTPGLYVVSFRNAQGVVVRKFVKM